MAVYQPRAGTGWLFTNEEQEEVGCLPTKSRKRLARDTLDAFSTLADLLMTLLVRTAKHKMAALAAVFSRLSNVYF